ncbi:hypothetical protein [Bailinhaonella thermotolerans]|uniref:Uncharacterized protein n=1 Tax=Bailinhaonella thermotolerans TaxID=1070861 RepID=A0A3A4A7P8_9ACTN|nr:hypothetical protein [Bailinhaonella thermotolerans]RJL21026.1 hypothetical protein D5H75_38075 [Bailinhaonella thermotolerans]
MPHSRRLPGRLIREPAPELTPLPGATSYVLTGQRWRIAVLDDAGPLGGAPGRGLALVFDLVLAPQDRLRAANLLCLAVEAALVLADHGTRLTLGTLLPIPTSSGTHMSLRVCGTLPSAEDAPLLSLTCP